MGGRAAEQLVFGELSTGAADDLARVTDIARAMVLRYGMSEALGSVAYDRDRSPFLRPNFPMPQERSYSEETAHAVDGAVRILVDRALERAAAILERNRAALHRAAVALLKTETLNEPEIALLKQQVAVDGCDPATLPHPIQDAGKAGSTAEMSARSTPRPCLKRNGVFSGLCRMIGATLATASRAV